MILYIIWWFHEILYSNKWMNWVRQRIMHPICGQCTYSACNSSVRLRSTKVPQLHPERMKPKPLSPPSWLSDLRRSLPASRTVGDHDTDSAPGGAPLSSPSSPSFCFFWFARGSQGSCARRSSPQREVDRFLGRCSSCLVIHSSLLSLFSFFILFILFLNIISILSFEFNLDYIFNCFHLALSVFRFSLLLLLLLLLLFPSSTVIPTPPWQKDGLLSPASVHHSLTTISQSSSSKFKCEYQVFHLPTPSIRWLAWISRDYRATLSQWPA